jgi:anti-anti-sigma factor
VERDDGTPAEFRAEATRHGTAVVISVRGELDIAPAPHLQGAVSDAAAGLVDEAGRAVVVVDLTECDFLDSTGCRSIALSARGIPSGVRLVLVCPESNRGVYRVLDFVQISAAVKIYGAPAEVFADFGGTPPEGLPLLP